MAQQSYQVNDSDPAYHNAAELLPKSERAHGVQGLKVLRRTGGSVLYITFDESLVNEDERNKDSGAANCVVLRVAMARDQTTMQQRFVHWRRNDIQLELSRHNNILSLCRAFEDIDSFTTVLEHFSVVPVFDALSSQGAPWGEDHFTKAIFRQIVAAVEFCHSRVIFHRDLNLQNITINGSDVKLTNFMSATRSDISENAYGFESYMSPECFKIVEKQEQIPYQSAPSDIWSLGIILIHLVTKSAPWKKPIMKDEQYCMYQLNRAHPNVSKKLVDILRVGILNSNPSLRYGISRVGTSIESCSKLHQPVTPTALAPASVGPATLAPATLAPTVLAPAFLDIDMDELEGFPDEDLEEAE